jgi:hypothetical protein
MTPRSWHFWLIAVAVACAVAGLHGAGRAQNFGSAPVEEQYFRVDTEGGLARNGRPVVRGYVQNRSPYDMGRIRLRVDPVSAEPRPVTPVTLGWVNGDIERNGRRYFEIAVPRADATYRVSVDSFEIRFNDLSK